MTDPQINETLRGISAQLGELRGDMKGVHTEMRRSNDQRDRERDSLWGAVEKNREQISALQKVGGILSAIGAAIGGWLTLRGG